MTILERAARAADRVQQRHPVLGFPVAVVTKYGDDQGGRLGALVAYYGFFSLFPLMLVFVSVLGFVLSGHPSLRDDIVDSAFGQFPVIGPALQARGNVHSLEGNWAGIAIGGATALWAGLAVAQAAEVAMNTVWDIPRAQWPNFVSRRLRALGMLALLGTITILSTFTSGYTSSGALPSGLLPVAGWAVSLLLNLVLFVVGFQVLTARSLPWRHVFPGAALSAVLWTVLQGAGSFYLTHQIASASDVYGTFALVLGLFVWIALGAQVTLLGAEVNVVWRRHLWPRRLVHPPINEADARVYAAVVERARIRPEMSVAVGFPADPHTAASDLEGTRASSRAAP
jgi:YihY family inner membrane protein